MLISINKIYLEQDREVLGEIKGHISEVDEYVYEFNQNNIFELDGNKIEVSASITKNNLKGSLFLKMNGLPYLNCLMTVDDVFILSCKVLEAVWLEITVST